MDKNLGSRIKEARKRAALTQEKLAKKLGIAYPTLNKYEKGHRTPDAELLGRMSRLLNCDPGWLLTGEDEGFREPAARIPILSRVPAGFPDNVSLEIIEYISLPDVPYGSCALIVKDEGMFPIIRDGDYIVFIPKEDIKNGDVVVVNDEWGESMLKRYREKNGEIFLVSDNTEYPTFRFNEQYKIMGKVIGVWRRVKI